ncbi:XRE family transcriptional regulator [Pseudomonas citronellolis]|uniref:XRE family transcriptional regulator n=1 Tax=Pseudomonas citronellolis TaxID=53408 RepID=UPI000778C8D0|nr:XRE family transcriptional regulator [Pseudomonas citronellolis]AMO73810.1 putative HTH-type transcriptional regulator [Pseudomonas citronellolis]MCP1606424.1 phage repressor protein C with HTH and peptisase S24 domain [Pseudomonas citronellolis]MCP1657130.1 phage repressor protein C with HTH and peptisase S24 domain [Pseudomonas citronellolis]MCP1724137.1 phage repressor protein C with HTH and peptisase S24 domain [Pseudomonas citronellolis]
MSEGLAARIRQCAEIAGSGDELARITAIPRRTLEYYLTGQSEPKVARCVEIAKAVGVDIGWLASGDGEPFPKPPQVTPLDDIYAFIPLYDARCSSGHGAWNERAKVLTKLAFTRYSLRKKGLNPESLACLRNDGDSMKGLIEDDDTVMIDLNRNTLEGEGVYVVLLDDHLYAKRLQRQFDGSVVIISHNKEYQPMTVPRERLPELQIVGRAVWAGGWLI